ncbi:MAG: response regulator [Methanoregula sp.]|jgi:CheY-like chemotaxis protein|uniref:response regulator n=1 Tax=Methanoregula sp. TaxID=2052170 RepID=UPI0025CCD69B|nr:response regulator [Methanoregula sp.]MCK9630431.1 response regulator [Methanoregula sp.]
MINVLYVDSDPKMWMIISHIFEKYCAVSIFPAGSGEEALGWLSQYHADVIVSDYILPGMSGTEFLHALRAGGITIPFIFFSESAHPYVKNKACREGISGFIPRKGLEKKPVLDLLRMVCWAAGSHVGEYPALEDLKRGA